MSWQLQPETASIYELDGRSVYEPVRTEYDSEYPIARTERFLSTQELGGSERSHSNTYEWSRPVPNDYNRARDSMIITEDIKPERGSRTSKELLIKRTSIDENISIDISSLDASSLVPNFAPRRGSGQEEQTSYYFPKHVDKPNWRPIVFKPPYLIFLTLVSLGLAGIQESLFRRSNAKGGLMQFLGLNDISVPEYFLWRYFPTIVTVTYGVAYQLVDVEAKRLEPYYRLAERSGSTFAQSLNVDSTNFWTWFRPPFPGSARTRLSTAISLVAVIAVPVIQNATLEVRAANDGFALFVHPIWSRVLSGSLIFAAVAGLLLLWPLHQSSGLSSDPCGISGLLAMTTRGHILSDFIGLSPLSSDEEINKSKLNYRKYFLYNSSLSPIEQLHWSPKLRVPSDRKEHSFTLPLVQSVPAFIFILSLLALVPVLIFTRANIILSRAPFLMTAIGVAVKLLWTLFDTNIRLTEPYYQLVRRHAKPSVLSVDYTGTMPFYLPIKALRNHDGTLALVATISILLEVLTVCLSSFGSAGANFMHRKGTSTATDLLEGDAQTFRSFWISLVLSISIIISLLVTAVYVYVQRSDVSLPRKPGTLAFVLLATHQAKMIVNWVGCEKLSYEQRRNLLVSWDKTYGFGWYQGRDGALHLGIDEEPLVTDYRRDDFYNSTAQPLGGHSAL